jgi:hypothetical protein
VKPITESEVIAGLLARLIGASGTRTMIPPFPGSEISDSPFALIAMI